MAFAAVLASIVTLVSPSGTAGVSTFGGVMTSWRPKDSVEVLALARPYEQCEKGTQIHGGFPVCWPWAVYEGPEGCRIHGVTRYEEWSVKERADDRLVLTLDDTASTRKVWPHPFHLELEYRLSDRLDVVFRATNTGTDPISCTELFHPYFNVGEASRCVVTGVDGTTYFWKGEPEKGDQRVWTGDFPCAKITTGAPGYVFEEGPRRHLLKDPVLGRTIDIAYRGGIKCILWNSGPSADVFGAGAEPGFGRRFVCVEGGTLYRDRAYTLRPGETHELAATIRVRQDADGKPPLRAALYVDNGCRGNGLIAWAEILRDSPDVDLKMVSGADIRAGALDDRELLVMPGGAGREQYGAFGDEGADRIRAFVAGGGAYLGTCCGFSNALNEKNNGYAKRLCMLPYRNNRAPRGMRGGFTSTVKFSAEGAAWLGIRPGDHAICYHNGPVVVRTEDVPLCTNVEVLATENCELAQHGKLADPMYGTPAVVKADYGKGRMLVFNCHPEAYRKTRYLVAAGIRALTGHDVRIVTQPLKARGAERVGFFTGKLGSKKAVEEYFRLRADPGIDVVPVTRAQLDEDWADRFDRIVNLEPKKK